MREFIGVLRPSALMLLVLSLLCGAVYPALVTGLAQALLPGRAAGSFLSQGNGVVGSELVGQNFDQPEWFWGRPSATAERPYDAAASVGSNLGPTNPALAQAVAERAAALAAADPQAPGPVPVDLLTASASGLDPHLSPEAAFYQVGRVARARGLDPAKVKALVQARVEGAQWLVFGRPRVNVLLLNLDLQGLAKAGEVR
jgi:K+-transporting ATPase ATPase C chain